jgi:hypothetical protein
MEPTQARSNKSTSTGSANGFDGAFVRISREPPVPNIR